MKKIIYALGVAALLASCSSNPYEDWADPQANGEESAETISLTAQAGDAVDFNNPNYSNAAKDSLKFYSYTIKSDQAVSNESKFLTLYSADKKLTTRLETDANNQVSASALQKAVESLYGKSDAVHEIPVTLTDSVRLASGTGYVLTSDFTSKVNLVTPSFGEYFYEIGNEVGWDASKEHALYGPDRDGKYEGFAYLNGEFKFKPNADNYDNDLEYAGDKSNPLSGQVADNGNGVNCPDPGAGFYQINLDLNAGTYTLTKVNVLSITGDGVGGWPSGDTDFTHDMDMTYNETDGCWEWTGTITADKGFKFRMNHAWDMSWGGKASKTDFDHMTHKDGINLEVSETATYKVQFYLTNEASSKVVITKQ